MKIIIELLEYNTQNITKLMKILVKITEEHHQDLSLRRVNKTNLLNKHRLFIVYKW